MFFVSDRKLEIKYALALSTRFEKIFFFVIFSKRYVWVRVKYEFQEKILWTNTVEVFSFLYWNNIQK